MCVGAHVCVRVCAHACMCVRVCACMCVHTLARPAAHLHVSWAHRELFCWELKILSGSNSQPYPVVSRPGKLTFSGLGG